MSVVLFVVPKSVNVKLIVANLSSWNMVLYDALNGWIWSDLVGTAGNIIS